MKQYEFLNLAHVNVPFMDRIRTAVDNVVLSGRYVGGEENARFERNMATLHNVDHAVGVSNGLDALRLIMEAYRILGKLREGDEIIVPANTYIATVMAIVQARLTPVLVEPTVSTLNIDSEAIRSALTHRTRAIMTVHLYGRVAYDETMLKIIRDNGLLLFEDNAQAIGAISATPGVYGNHMTGALGDASAFSFYPTKNVGAMGDAGAVLTSHSEVAEVVRALSNYGSDRRYHNIYNGFNCRLDPVQAAVLNVKLPYLEKESERRRKLAAEYCSAILSPLIVTPKIPSMEKEHVWHQFVILAPERDRLRKYLADNGVQTDVHYATPPHRQPCYADLFTGLHLPITDHIADRAISLPMSPATTPQDAREISAIINRF